MRPSNTVRLRTLCVAVALACAAQRPAPANPPPESLERLKADCEQVVTRPEADALESLAKRALDFAEQADDRDEALSALRVVGDLCRIAQPSDAERWRAAAMRRLVLHAPRSGRARVLLTQHFLPALVGEGRFATLPAALVRFDALLDQLALGCEDATRRDLVYARCLARFAVHRSEPAAWFSEEERTRVDHWLTELAAAAGASPDGTSWSEVADELRAELRDTPFGRALGEVSARDLDGRIVRLREYHGKVVVLSFWSSWCLPCLEMIPAEADLLRRLSARGVALVGVNSDASVDVARAAAARHGITWPQLRAPLDDTGSLVRQLHIREWPSVIVLDQRGAIAAKFVGSRAERGWSLADVEREVVRLLASPRTAP